MSLKIKLKSKNENASAAFVFSRRRKDALGRCDMLKRVIEDFLPSEDDIDRDTISNMDYILESLDTVIKDVKKATGRLM